MELSLVQKGLLKQDMLCQKFTNWPWCGEKGRGRTLPSLSKNTEPPQGLSSEFSTELCNKGIINLWHSLPTIMVTTSDVGDFESRLVNFILAVVTSHEGWMESLCLARVYLNTSSWETTVGGVLTSCAFSWKYLVDHPVNN